jgi:galactokinase
MSSAELATAFEAEFGLPPTARAFAPGRVNVLGEYTDLCGGFVLPSALARGTTVLLAPSRDDRWRYLSWTLAARLEHADEEAATGFARYVHGCALELRARGWHVPPLSVGIASDLPVGSGLSSSASLEVATLRALTFVLDLPFDDAQLAQLAHAVENDRVGVPCGMMDQMACSLGRTGEALFVDTLSGRYEHLSLPRGASLVVLHSGVSRQLEHTGYASRRAECEQAAAALGVPLLRHVERLERAAELPEPLDRRARHVIAENGRVQAAVQADARELGRLMDASHASLRDDFEVSTPALDALVEAARAHPAVYGARLTGAGFGGAVVALVAAGQDNAVRKDALERYARGGYAGWALE